MGLQPQRNYVVIAPVRDEERCLPGTIRSMAEQTIKPVCWVIVNDGSTDRTGAIAQEGAQKHPWIKVVNRANRGFRKAGGGVVDAFYDGYEQVGSQDWQFLVKLDGDLTFDPSYFAQCFERFEQDPRLGIAGGTVCIPVNGRPEPEAKADPKFHVRGATKIYRRACWDQIGGLLRAPGWDTLDELKANMLGWSTLTFDDIRVMHHRPTGAAYGTWSDRVKAGLANYITGYHPLFMLMKCLKRLGEKPYVIGSCGLLFGFLKGYVRRVPQVPDPELIRYLRQQQINKLLVRKSLWS